MSFKSRLVLFTSLWFLVVSVVIAHTYQYWQKETIEQRTKQSFYTKNFALHMRDDNPYDWH